MASLTRARTATFSRSLSVTLSSTTQTTNYTLHPCGVIHDHWMVHSTRPMSPRGCTTLIVTWLKAVCCRRLRKARQGKPWQQAALPSRTGLKTLNELCLTHAPWPPSNGCRPQLYESDTAHSVSHIPAWAEVSRRLLVLFAYVAKISRSWALSGLQLELSISADKGVLQSKGAIT